MSPQSLPEGTLPRGDHPVRHGYSLTSIARLAIYAAHRTRWGRLIPLSERIEVAWSAVAEHLCAAEEAPTTKDLFGAACSAIAEHANRWMRFRGLNTRAPGTTRSFARYWNPAADPFPHPETRAVETTALKQIWPRLTPSQQQVLEALAAYGDPAHAAQALDKSPATFANEVYHAREVFRTLWRTDLAPARTTSASSDHRPRRAPHEDTGAAVRPRRRRIELDISDADLIHRYQAGESTRQLAAALGVSASLIYSRLSEFGILRPPPGPQAPRSALTNSSAATRPGKPSPNSPPPSAAPPPPSTNASKPPGLECAPALDADAAPNALQGRQDDRRVPGSHALGGGAQPG